MKQGQHHYNFLSITESRDFKYIERAFKSSFPQLTKMLG